MTPAIHSAPRPRGAALALLGMASLVACGGDGPGGRALERDSAGVAIVESRTPAWEEGTGFTVDPEPVLDLTEVGAGPEHEFYGVSDGALLSGGSIALAERSTGQIKFFSAAGEFLGGFGSEGAGPEQFRWVRELHAFAGDSLLAFDQGNRRVSIIGPDRELARTVPITLQSLFGAYPLDRETLVLRIGAPGETRATDPGHRRMPLYILTATRDGTVLDTVTVGIGSESVSLRGGAIDAVPFFGKNTHVAVHDGQIYVGDSDSLQVRRYSGGGELERIMRIRGRDLAVREGDVEAEAALRVEVNPRNRDINEMLPRPTHRPAYADIVVDSEGHVWAEEHKGRFRNMLEDSPTRWEVFAPDGTWLGSVAMPGRFRVWQIGRDVVLGLRRDALDLERPQLLRLNR